MAAADKANRKYLHAAKVITAENESSLLDVSELIKQGSQLVVLTPYGKSREESDALTERLIETSEELGASVSVVQVGPTRPRRWRRWLARLNANRMLIVTPDTLTSPTVGVFWVPDAKNGTQRLLLGESLTFRTGVSSREVRRD